MNHDYPMIPPIKPVQFMLSFLKAKSLGMDPTAQVMKVVDLQCLGWQRLFQWQCDGDMMEKAAVTLW